MLRFKITLTTTKVVVVVGVILKLTVVVIGVILKLSTCSKFGILLQSNFRVKFRVKSE